jgi:hypothetical protein
VLHAKRPSGNLSGSIFRTTVDVFMCPEFLRELLRLPSETNSNSPESHPSCVLNFQVTESADTLDRDSGQCAPPNILFGSGSERKGNWRELSLQ